MNTIEDEPTQEEKERTVQETVRRGIADLWLDLRLSKEAMDHLWDDINGKETDSRGKETDARKTLAGNISKSKYIPDKDNWFWENVLKEMTEHLYYKDWNNYYDVVVRKFKSPLEFALKDMWVNYQKQHEFNPPHGHSGVFSFVIFMKIPTHWKEQHALPISANSNHPCASDFQFITIPNGGPIGTVEVPLCPEDEGRILFFPAWEMHQVFPFYGTEEERITISGNIIYKDAS